MTNTEFARQLIDLAAIYLKNDDVPQIYGLNGDGSEFVFCHSKAAFDAAIKAFGPGEVIDEADSLVMLSRVFPGLRVCGFKSALNTPTAPETEISEVEAWF